MLSTVFSASQDAGCRADPLRFDRQCEETRESVRMLVRLMVEYEGCSECWRGRVRQQLDNN